MDFTHTHTYTHTHTRITWILGFLPSSFVCPAESFLVYSPDFAGLWHPDHKAVLPSYTFLPLCLDLSYSLCLISHVIGNWFKFLQVNASGQFCGGSRNGWTKMTSKRTQITGSKKMGWAVNWLLSWRMQAGNVKHIENWIGGCAGYVLDLQPSDVPADLGFFFFF